jgi:predicted dehydrogenase
VKYIASAKGLSARIMAGKAGARAATSDYHEILADPEVKLVIISTRHDLHGTMVKECMDAGKHVFVEKPLCIRETELQSIIEANEKRKYRDPVMLMVGFNRRFAPLAVKLKTMAGPGPMNIIATMNAGFIPPEVWVHDPDIGGGRIVGEACHYIDLCTFLTGSRVTSVYMHALGVNPAENTDNASITLGFANGSHAVINYFSNGNKAYSKERIELYSQERTFVLDNWRSLTAYGIRGMKTMRSRQDKGHKHQFALLTKCILSGGEPLIPFDEIIGTTQATFDAMKSLKEGRVIYSL